MKLFLEERETAVMHAIWRNASRVASTRLVHVETRAAIARARRARRLSAPAAATARDTASTFLREVHLVDVEAAVVATAAELADAHVLRGYDAVHLASALALRDRELAFVTWDRDLRRAAASEGLATPA